MNASSLFGKRVVLVGGTAGLGTVLLRECVRLGAAKVYLVCRSDGDRGRGEMLNQGGRALSRVTIVRRVAMDFRSKPI